MLCAVTFIYGIFVVFCGIVDAETGQVKVDILSDPDCWTNKHCLLDILVRMQVCLNLLSEIWT